MMVRSKMSIRRMRHPFTLVIPGRPKMVKPTVPIIAMEEPELWRVMWSDSESDERKLAARNCLAEMYIETAEKLADVDWFDRCEEFCESDDRRSAAYAILLNAIPRFKGLNDASFKTYLAKKMGYEVYDELSIFNDIKHRHDWLEIALSDEDLEKLKMAKRQKRATPFHVPRTNFDDLESNEDHHSDSDPDDAAPKLYGESLEQAGYDDESAVRNDTRSRQWILIAERVSEDELQILSWKAEGKTFKEIAATLGVQVRTVSKRHKRAIAKARGEDV